MWQSGAPGDEDEVTDAEHIDEVAAWQLSDVTSEDDAAPPPEDSGLRSLYPLGPSLLDDLLAPQEPPPLFARAPRPLALQAPADATPLPLRLPTPPPREPSPLPLRLPTPPRAASTPPRPSVPTPPPRASVAPLSSTPPPRLMPEPERVRVGPRAPVSAPLPRPATLPPAPRGSAPAEPAASGARSSPTALRAKQLVESAQLEIENLDRIAALMNLKLALAFEPDNLEVRRLIQEVTQETAGTNVDPLRNATAQKNFDAGCAAELKADVETAIRCFEIALKHEESPVVMNRLGILLGTKRQAYERADSLLERASALAPSNEVYASNRLRLRARAASAPPPVAPTRASRAPREKIEARPSLFGGLFGRPKTGRGSGDA